MQMSGRNSNLSVFWISVFNEIFFNNFDKNIVDLPVKGQRTFLERFIKKINTKKRSRAIPQVSFAFRVVSFNEILQN